MQPSQSWVPCDSKSQEFRRFSLNEICPELVLAASTTDTWQGDSFLYPAFVCFVVGLVGSRTLVRHRVIHSPFLTRLVKPVRRGLLFQ